VRRRRARRDDANVPERTVALQQFKLERSFGELRPHEMAADLQCTIHVSGRVTWMFHNDTFQTG
jgi:hypothetical protein